MNTAEIVPLEELDPVQDEFEIELIVKSKELNAHCAYILSQREIDHGHVPRIVEFMKDKIRKGLYEG